MFCRVVAFSIAYLNAGKNAGGEGLGPRPCEPAFPSIAMSRCSIPDENLGPLPTTLKESRASIWIPACVSFSTLLRKRKGLEKKYIWAIVSHTMFLTFFYFLPRVLLSQVNANLMPSKHTHTCTRAHKHTSTHMHTYTHIRTLDSFKVVFSGSLDMEHTLLLQRADI